MSAPRIWGRCPSSMRMFGVPRRSWPYSFFSAAVPSVWYHAPWCTAAVPGIMRFVT